ncbi:hypothetical protein GY45DRAFT_98087 [Cubamyces sp. BRFM 1775]|nr:hypothetical protein GY45DRAFT_98087 [Cubamyces sp. BRFM 1775]
MKLCLRLVHALLIGSIIRCRHRACRVGTCSRSGEPLTRRRDGVVLDKPRGLAVAAENVQRCQFEVRTFPFRERLVRLRLSSQLSLAQIPLWRLHLNISSSSLSYRLLSLAPKPTA